MREVNVKRVDMMKRVKENRDNHKAVVIEALDGYRKAVIEELDKMIADAKAGRQIRTTVTLVQPQDHTREYDRVLDMLNLSVDDEITLSADDFNCYMRDEWSWDRQFAASNTQYVRSASATAYLSGKGV